MNCVHIYVNKSNEHITGEGSQAALVTHPQKQLGLLWSLINAKHTSWADIHEPTRTVTLIKKPKTFYRAIQYSPVLGHGHMCYELPFILKGEKNKKSENKILVCKERLSRYPQETCCLEYHGGVRVLGLNLSIDSSLHARRDCFKGQAKSSLWGLSEWQQILATCKRLRVRVSHLNT